MSDEIVPISDTPPDRHLAMRLLNMLERFHPEYLSDEVLKKLGAPRYTSWYAKKNDLPAIKLPKLGGEGLATIINRLWETLPVGVRIMFHASEAISHINRALSVLESIEREAPNPKLSTLIYETIDEQLAGIAELHETSVTDPKAIPPASPDKDVYQKNLTEMLDGIPWGVGASPVTIPLFKSETADALSDAELLAVYQAADGNNEFDSSLSGSR